MRVVRRSRQAEQAANSASVRLGSDWAEAPERRGSSSIWMATLTRQCPVEANLIFEDGPGTRIVINTDAPDCSLIYVKRKNVVEQHCAKRPTDSLARQFRH